MYIYIFKTFQHFKQKQTKILDMIIWLLGFLNLS